MIQEINYSQMESGSYTYQNFLLEQANEQLNNINQLSSELKNTFKKQTHQLKFIKQLKSKDIKLSHKKFQILPNKVNPTVKNISSFSKQRQSIFDDKTLQNKPFQNEEITNSIKIKKKENFQKLEGKQFSNEAVNLFNPETVVFTRQSTILNREKISKKLKVSEINNFHQRVRQSRSQSKKEKNNSHNGYQNTTKSTFNTYENQGNIFQNSDFLAKHNSYHSLDKNQQNNYSIGFSPLVSSKFEQKLHLPSLVSNNGFKNIKNKAQQTISLAHEHHETQVQRQNFSIEGGSKTQKSTPYIQKTVKIAIDRLKPLRPEQIKLKFQQKVKEEQKNRAKQRAIQMFQKEQEQAQLKKQQLNFMHNLESEEGQLCEKENKQTLNEEFQDIKSRPSLMKRQKLNANNKGENIFKKN